jgi:multidrug transporter EmrE-like cation transporter
LKTFLLAILSVGISVAAQFSFKAGVGPLKALLANKPLWSLDFVIGLATNMGLLSGFVLYAVGAIIWLGVLASWDVSKAYPLVGFGFVLTLIVGHMLGEAISAPRIAGVILICMGVVVIAKS